MYRSMADSASNVSAIVANPFPGRLTIGGDDGRRSAVPFHDDLVDVGGVGGVEGLEAEVIDDEDLDADQFAQLDVVAAVETGEPWSRLRIWSQRPARVVVATAAGDVAKGGGHNVLPTPTGPMITASWPP